MVCFLVELHSGNVLGLDAVFCPINIEIRRVGLSVAKAQRVACEALGQVEGNLVVEESFGGEPYYEVVGLTAVENQSFIVLKFRVLRVVSELK